MKIRDDRDDRSGHPVPLRRLLADAGAALRRAGIEQPMREARLLLAAALGIPIERLLALEPDAPCPVQPFHDHVRRRRAREPLAYILGASGFWTLDLLVSPATLIPRADTESLIEAAREGCRDPGAVRTILDLGTGTGALLLAGLVEFPHAAGIGIDGLAACRLARRNASRNGLDARAGFVAADWTAPLASSARFDLVLSNPPYIPTGEIASLMPEVSRHEPVRALDGGADGLDAYRRILPALPGLLEAGGLAVIEIGAGQLDAVRAIGLASGLRWDGVRQDLGGHPRATRFRTHRAAASNPP